MNEDEVNPDIDDSPHALIYRWLDSTKLHLAKHAPGCFGGKPTAAWSRRLSDDETKELLENPWCVFDRHPGVLEKAR